MSYFTQALNLLMNIAKNKEQNRHGPRTKIDMDQGPNRHGPRTKIDMDQGPK